VTEKNTLNFSIGVGYLKYLRRSELDHLYISPDSGLAFDIYVGDFTIDLHDRFSITESVAQSPTVSGTGDFSHSIT